MFEKEAEELDKMAEKHIADLEKENAELKKLKRECETSLCRAEYQYNYEQLTKAKELLKGIVDTPMYYQMGGETYESEEYKELIAEAESFLKENE